MNSTNSDLSFFQLFDSAGVGLLGIDSDNRAVQANESFLRYLDIEADEIVGEDIASLKTIISLPDFWQSLLARETFYSLVPARNFLLLAISRSYPEPSPENVKRLLLVRPYSLEREFMRMRTNLNQNVALEIRSHLNSVAIASEIILQPELQESEPTKKRFLATFFKDITDLSTLFSEMQEIVEPIPFPNRIHRLSLDWKALVTDQLSKVRGLASERNIFLTSDIPAHLPAIEGDYHWLYLALYGAINYLVTAAPALAGMRIACHADDRGIETTIRIPLPEIPPADLWPPPTIFPLPEENPRIGKMLFSELALARSIILLHQGELERTEEYDSLTLRVTLPA
jgi:signal transduction histidine kinase